MNGEHQLPEGLGGLPVRISERGVHRPTGPWTPTVHAFLAHLATVGFDGAPRVLGIDEAGEETLTYIEGEVLGAGPTWQAGQPTPWPVWAQTEDCLVATAQLLRRFHTAAATFEPPTGAVWRRYHVPALGDGEAVCHGDVGPHNTVYRDGLPVGFIDWDTIRPDDPLIEFGTAAWKYVPLGDDAYFQTSDFPQPPPLARRLALFARAYGIENATTVMWALQQAKQRSAETLRYFPVTAAEAATDLRRIAADLDWLHSARTQLVTDLD